MKIARLIQTWTFIACVGASQLAASTVTAQGAVTEQDWARMLVRSFGIDTRKLPEGVRDRPPVDILRSKGTGPILATAFTQRSKGIIEIDEAATGDSKERSERWLKSDTGTNTLVYQAFVARPGLYMLRARAKGGTQIWTIGSNPSKTVTFPANPKDPTLIGPFPLQGGTFGITASLTAGSSLERFEVVPPWASPIEPAGGWTATAPLTFGAKAQTMVKALQLESELATEPPESFHRVVRANERNKSAFTVTIATPGVYSLSAWVDGPNPEGSIIDGAFSPLRRPRALPGLGQRGPAPLATGFLTKGTHTVNVMGTPDSKVTGLVVRRKVATPEEYVRVLLKLAGSRAEELEGNPRATDRVGPERALSNVGLFKSQLVSLLSTSAEGIGGNQEFARTGGRERGGESPQANSRADHDDDSNDSDDHNIPVPTPTVLSPFSGDEEEDGGDGSTE